MTALASPTPDQAEKDAEYRRRRDAILAALLSLLTFGTGDIDAARVLWQRHAQPAYAGLLDGSGQYVFDPTTQLYTRASTGRVIQPAELKRVAVQFAQGVGRDVMEPDAVKVAENEIAVEKWAANMVDDVKDLALVETALGRGGFDQISPPAITRLLGSEDQPPGLRFTIDRLASFAVEIEDHAARADSTAAIVNRAGMYAAASNSVFEQQRRDSHMDAKDGSGRATHLYERNVLTPGDNCHNGKFTTGCIEVTEAGWQPIGSLPLPGLRTCAMLCKCSMEFSLTGGAHERN